MSARPDGPPRRILWAGPMNAASAIGRVGVGVAEALDGRGADVELAATDYEWSADAPRQSTSLPVRPVAELDLPRLALDYDHVVVNVGDHFLNHAGVFPLLTSAPCVAVMHDAYLGNLFNGWLWWNGSQPHLREAEVVATYGPSATALVRRQVTGGMTLAEEAARLPMTEWVARQAAGCLAHSAFYAPRLTAACAGPVEVAGLPVPGRGLPPLEPRSPSGRLTLLTVGVVNPNKCADRVIEALAASPALRERVAYRLVGPVTDDERARLEALAARVGYRGLSMEGAATDAELDAALAASDIIACLRSPVLEGASASVADALHAGRPTLVADAGCYADLPDDTVVKLPADVPVRLLTAALEGLADDEPGRRALGGRARRYAEARFTVDAYLAVLEPLMAATARATPLLRTGRVLGARLADLGVSRDDPVVARMASAVESLLSAG